MFRRQFTFHYQLLERKEQRKAFISCDCPIYIWMAAVGTRIQIHLRRFNEWHHLNLRFQNNPPNPRGMGRVS